MMLFELLRLHVLRAAANSSVCGFASFADFILTFGQRHMSVMCELFWKSALSRF
jgi:hypothetical protein